MLIDSPKKKKKTINNFLSKKIVSIASEDYKYLNSSQQKQRDRERERERENTKHK